MSDDDKNGEGIIHPNAGITLPDKEDATHNGGLSPLFTTKSGYIRPYHIDMQHHGMASYLQSNVSYGNGDSFLANLAHNPISPSLHHARFFAWSLRCLVSTNNRIIINLVSDDLDESTGKADGGVSLPDGIGATHNATLSPLFWNRGGFNSPFPSGWPDITVLVRGSAGLYWSTTSIASETARVFAVDGNAQDIFPSSYGGKIYGRSLCCLVSTNNRIIINEAKHSVYLVSDDDKNGDWTANRGGTLPDREDATYNINLLPLFMAQIGDVNTTNLSLSHLGKGWDAWSSTTIVAKQNEARLLAIDSSIIWPSTQWSRAGAYSLRCLVSTNNRLC